MKSLFDLPQRIIDKIDPEPMTGCWLWNGAVAGLGYGSVYINGKKKYSHRAIYELLCAPIPKDLTIDHLCRQILCCNPSHLEPVTIKENIRRGDGFSGKNAKKTHCPKGHPLSGKNLKLIRGKGKDGEPARTCRKCKAINWMNWWRRWRSEEARETLAKQNPERLASVALSLAQVRKNQMRREKAIRG